MEHFVQAVALALIAAVLGLVLEKQGKDLAVLLTMAACAMILASAMTYLRPILAFLEELRGIGNFGSDMIGILLKVAGIGIVTEVAVMVCADAGNNSLGKALGIGGSAVILWLSIPIFTAMMELVQEILGGL